MCTKTKTVKFSDIKTPITKKGFRRNLKKYYFCHGNDLLVNGETISISNLNKLTDLYKYYSEPKITPLIKYEIDDVYNYIMSNPFRKITALGGISNANDVIEFILAGADLVQIGTMNYQNPNIGIDILNDLEKYCKNNNLKNLLDIKGKVEYYEE